MQIPVEAIHSQAGSADRDAVEAVFRDAGIDSAVIAQPPYGWYYALVPPGSARSWIAPGECFGLSHSIGVPAPHRADPPGTFWLLTPPTSTDELCSPVALVSLITVAGGFRLQGREVDDEDPEDARRLHRGHHQSRLPREEHAVSSLDTAFLEDLAHAAERDGITKTVVGAVIADNDGKVLLLHRSADDYLGGLWELPSGGVDDGEDLIEALHREVAEETGLTVTAVGGYLGHFDYRSGSGRATRQFNFGATAIGETVELTEHDAHLWANRAQQGQVSSAVQAVLSAWRDQTS